MHHSQPSTEDERRPLFVPSPSSGLSHPPKDSESHIVDYRTSDKSILPLTGSNQKSTSRNSSDSESEDDIESGNSSSAASINSSLVPNTPGSASQGTGPNPPSRRHSRRRISYRLQMFLTILSQLGILGFFGTMAGVIAKAPWEYPYSWHPICMGLYGFIATEAILILQPVEKAAQKKTAKVWHGYLQTLAFLLSIAGFIAIYANKDKRGKPHFASNHALYGCTSVFIFFFQVVFGTVIAYLPRSVFQRIGHARVTRIHRVVGYISIAFMWITLWLSVLTNWMKRNFDQHEWIFALSMGMIGVGVVGQITPSRLFGARRRTPAP
ncbi:eukaryotic cytochrome b561-domain-containing protein [Mortierella sp. GBAus27b]|nr:hypothetical protein BGX31_006325 [Mortierella sp. GBA43]KAI8362524.1 eukaryotic cytochrome b561-domain-containing protein [Mortierella sp. GBAus27b]